MPKFKCTIEKIYDSDYFKEKYPRLFDREGADFFNEDNAKEEFIEDVANSNFKMDIEEIS